MRWERSRGRERRRKRFKWGRKRKRVLERRKGRWEGR